VVGTITRPVVDVLPEQIGLSLEEGQQLLRGVQMAILADQSHRYELGRVRCSDCGRRQRIKDTRRKCKPAELRRRAPQIVRRQLPARVGPKLFSG